MMPVESMAKLKKSLIKHEGFRNKPYLDTTGKVTIGIGFNLSDRGLTDDWINDQYLQDVFYFFEKLSQFKWFNELNDDRKIILIDMCFMGWKKFIEFEKMIGFLERHAYVSAASEMRESEWAKQVGQRAIDLSNGMIKGVYNV